jgi:hypothetical protein
MRVVIQDDVKRTRLALGAEPSAWVFYLMAHLPGLASLSLTFMCLKFKFSNTASATTTDGGRRSSGCDGHVASANPDRC